MYKYEYIYIYIYTYTGQVTGSDKNLPDSGLSKGEETQEDFQVKPIRSKSFKLNQGVVPSELQFASLPPVIPLIASSQVGPDPDLIVSKSQKKEDAKGDPEEVKGEVKITSSAPFTTNSPKEKQPSKSNTLLSTSPIKFRDMLMTNLFGTSPVKVKQEIADLKLVLSPPIITENFKETKDDHSLPLPPTQAQHADVPSEAELQAIRERIALLESKL
jgi:hypothetical protein